MIRVIFLILVDRLTFCQLSQNDERLFSNWILKDNLSFPPEPLHFSSSDSLISLIQLNTIFLLPQCSDKICKSLIVIVCVASHPPAAFSAFQCRLSIFDENEWNVDKLYWSVTRFFTWHEFFFYNFLRFLLLRDILLLRYLKLNRPDLNFCSFCFLFCFTEAQTANSRSL